MLHARYVRCDVFSSQPFGGNPLAVFTDARSLDPPTMQAIAREMNLSETAFVLPGREKGIPKIRIFTPKLELGFAGHPTLGTAFILARPLQTDSLVLETGVGNIAVYVARDGADPTAATMDLPLPVVAAYNGSATLLAGLGLSSAVTPIRQYTFGITHLLVQVATAEQVQHVTPNLEMLAALGPVGVVVFAQTGTAIRARVFLPGAGVAEDPATGSAVAPIALHVHSHATSPIGRTLSITQGTEIGRPSELRAELVFEEDRLTRILVGGQCVLLGRGEWQLPGRSTD